MTCARSITWGEAQTPQDERSLAIDYATRASIRQERGDLPGAEADIAASLAWFRTNLPNPDRRMAIILRIGARIAAASGDWSEAQRRMTESVGHHEQAFGADHEWTRRARSWQTAIVSRTTPPRWTDTTPQTTQEQRSGCDSIQ